MPNQNHTQDLKGLIQSQTRLIEDQSKLIKKMACQLREVQQAMQELINPNYRRPLSDFRTFNWSTIGSIVLKEDQGGPTEVKCGHYRYTRRSGSGKFGQAIWYSRCVGQNETGKVYVRLITFKDRDEAEELDGKVAQVLPQSAPQSKQPKTKRPAQARQNQSKQPAAKAPTTQVSKSQVPVTQVPVVGPTTAPAQSEKNPRLVFSRMGSQAVREKLITPDKYNQLANIGRTQNYNVALNELQQCLP